MPHPFFKNAVAAAKIGLGALSTEFEKPEANANICSEGDKGQPLIYRLICGNRENGDSFNDDELLILLPVLIKHKVNLSYDEDYNSSILERAIERGKMKTAILLAENDAGINREKAGDLLIWIIKKAALNRSKVDQFTRLIKTLMEKSARRVIEPSFSAFLKYFSSAVISPVFPW